MFIIILSLSTSAFRDYCVELLMLRLSLLLEAPLVVAISSSFYSYSMRFYISAFILEACCSYQVVLLQRYVMDYRVFIYYCIYLTWLRSYWPCCCSSQIQCLSWRFYDSSLESQRVSVGFWAGVACLDSQSWHIFFKRRHYVKSFLLSSCSFLLDSRRSWSWLRLQQLLFDAYEGTRGLWRVCGEGYSSQLRMLGWTCGCCQLQSEPLLDLISDSSYKNTGQSSFLDSSCISCRSLSRWKIF